MHDRGGLAAGEPIDRAEHMLADWELLVDALQQALVRNRVITVDELRRGIEGMEREHYERASYYERWLHSLETLLVEKGVVEAGEVERALG